MKTLISAFLLSLVTITYSDTLPQIAVANFDGNAISESDLDGLSNRLRIELVKTDKFVVLERSRMNEILSEQGFQNTGCTNSECAVQIGQLVNVHYIVIGSLDKVSSVYSVSVRLVDVASGKITVASNEDCINCDLSSVLLVTIPNVAKKLAGITSEDPTDEPQNNISANVTFQSEELMDWERHGLQRSDWAKYKRSNLELNQWLKAKRRKEISAKGLIAGYSLAVTGIAFLIAKNEVLKKYEGNSRRIRYRNYEIIGSIALGISIPVTISHTLCTELTNARPSFSTA